MKLRYKYFYHSDELGYKEFDQDQLETYLPLLWKSSINDEFRAVVDDRPGDDWVGFPYAAVVDVTEHERLVIRPAEFAQKIEEFINAHLRDHVVEIMATDSYWLYWQLHNKERLGGGESIDILNI